MAQKNDKLFDREQIDTDKSGTKSAAISDGHTLIGRAKSADTDKIRAERLEALKYAETYRQKLRLEKEARRSRADLENEERQRDARLERESALNAERQKEIDRAREDSDRVRELLMRLDKSSDGQAEDGSPEADALPSEDITPAQPSASESKDKDDFTPITKSHQEDVHDDSDAAGDNLISIDMDIKSEVLHIDGINLGEIKVGNTVVAESCAPDAVYQEGRYSSADSAAQMGEPRLISRRNTDVQQGTADGEYERELITKSHKAQSSIYTDTDDVGELLVDGGLDISSAYPEAGREYIAQGGAVKTTAFDKETDIALFDTVTGLTAYPDPEAPQHNDLDMHIDDTLMDPLPDVPKNEPKLTHRQRREHARAMRELEREDMLRFERESRTAAHFNPIEQGNKDCGEDIPGSIYPDPDYVTDEPVLYAAGGPVSKEREREALLQYHDFYGKEYADKEGAKEQPEAPVFNKRELKRLVKKSRALDILCVEQMYESRLRELRLELQSKELRFGRKKDKDERTARDVQMDIKRLENEQRRALREAEADNERYYAPVLTDYSTVKLKGGARRELLIQKRADLLDELARRDEINSRLLSLYTGKEDGRRAHFEGRVMAEMKAKRRAFRRQRRLDREIVKYHISYSFSKRLYALMDEYVSLSGEIARLEYSLKKEKLLRTVKRDMKKERRKLKRKLVRVSDHIEYYERRAILEAEDRREVKRKMIIGWAVLLGIIALGVLAYAFWEPLTAYISSVYGGGV